MASVHHNYHPPSTSSKSSKNPNTSRDTADKNPNPNPNPSPNPNPNPNPSPNPNPNPNPNQAESCLPLGPSPQDLSLSTTAFLTRQELLRRRSHHLKQLSECYRDHYWALTEELKVQYREYYWKYGVSPFKEDEEEEKEEERESEDNINEDVEGSGETNDNNNDNYYTKLLGLGIDDDVKNNHQCVFLGCNLKAMALTRFCNLHILYDSRQKLYKPCAFVIKSAQVGPITCGKPILRSTVPALCAVHFQKAQKHVTRALKNAGLNVSSPSKLAPKLHVIVTEYVRQIQAKRRAGQVANSDNVVIKEESAS